MLADKLINLVLSGKDPESILEDLILGPTVLLSEFAPSIRRPGRSAGADNVVRSYFSSTGELKFCTIDDVQISPDSDNRLMELLVITDMVPADHEVLTWLDNYEGPIDEIHRKVTSSFCLVR